MSEEYADARDRMVRQLADRGRIDRESTLEALRSVPRHEFVPEGKERDAYRDRPLPIGSGQTISAPHMVGMMTDLLAAEPGEEVLEIGTGRGYHAAVTAEVVEDVRESQGDSRANQSAERSSDGNVYSVEYHGELAERAHETLDRLGYDVHVRVGDGREGWPEHAPYDAAYLTCAPAEIPDPIVEQVREGGVVVGPTGRRRQRLVRLRVGEEGVERRETHGGVRFVEMKGD